MSWEREDTERWLTDYPLPADFVWNDEVVWPRYELKNGYGFWLKTAGPYHPALRGLFGLVHDILAEKSVTGARAPSPDELAAELRAYATVQATLGIEDPAPPPAATGQGIDFARRLQANQPPSTA
jgi:hypothetical protein